MSTNVQHADEPSATTDVPIDDRTRRALTECMTVLPDGGDLFTVVGQHGNGEYRVAAREGRCTCPDSEYREPENGCKHVRRVRFATGKRAIPAGVDQSAIDDLIGTHVDGELQYVATDGGVEMVSGTDTDRADSLVAQLAIELTSTDPMRGFAVFNAVCEHQKRAIETAVGGTQ